MRRRSGCCAGKPERSSSSSGRETFRFYVKKVLVPTLQPDNIVTMDNLGSHKGKAVRQFVRPAPNFSSCRITRLTPT